MFLDKLSLPQIQTVLGVMRECDDGNRVNILDEVTHDIGAIMEFLSKLEEDEPNIQAHWNIYRSKRGNRLSYSSN